MSIFLTILSHVGAWLWGIFAMWVWMDSEEEMGDQPILRIAISFGSPLLIPILFGMFAYSRCKKLFHYLRNYKQIQYVKDQSRRQKHADKYL